MNTAFMDGVCPDEVWLKGDLEILQRCDAICMLHNWEESSGAKVEHDFAHSLGLEFYYETIDGVIHEALEKDYKVKGKT